MSHSGSMMVGAVIDGFPNPSVCGAEASHSGLVRLLGEQL